MNNAIANASSGAYASEAALLTDFATNGAAFINTIDLANVDTGAFGGADVDGGAVKTATSAVPNTSSRLGEDETNGFAETFEAVGGGGAANIKQFQVGANAGQMVATNIGGVNQGTMNLQRAGTTMVAQANQVPQGVLALLRG